MATLGIISAVVYMWLSGSDDQTTIVYLGISGLLSVIFVYYVIKIRLSTWKVNCGGPDKAIKHAIAGCQSSLSYIRLVKFSCFSTWPFANWYVYAATQQTDRSPTLGLIITNVMFMILWFITRKFYQKRVEELKQLQDSDEK